MRGKLLDPYDVVEKIGITPADAGKTAVFGFCHGLRQDHPRGCGENSRGSKKSKTAAGSPPRMRGKHVSLNYVLGR